MSNCGTITLIHETVCSFYDISHDGLHTIQAACIIAIRANLTLACDPDLWPDLEVQRDLMGVVDGCNHSLLAAEALRNRREERVVAAVALLRSSHQLLRPLVREVEVAGTSLVRLRAEVVEAVVGKVEEATNETVEAAATAMELLTAVLAGSPLPQAASYWAVRAR